ncbi:MAG TPA: hypothetical protein PKA76_10800 [Pirellulaceae bacterium]|nr:hypothetical protein [Pirellulaceae bacterium]HMP69831.1 hypothetical protein [Pirellulaceae bacterium]
MNAFDDLLKRSNEISSEDQADDKSLPLEMPTKLVSRWENLVSEMSEVLMLDETQKERIKESLGNEATKIKNWLKEYGSLVENIDKKIIDAAKNRDLSELKELVRRGTELRSEITDLYQGFKDSAMNSLPQDKRAEWQGHLLLKRFNEMIEDLDLRPEQEEAVGRLAVSIAMKTGSSSSWESEGISQLMKLFEQDVLEKEQKDQWDLLQQVDPKKYLPGFDLWQ